MVILLNLNPGLIMKMSSHFYLKRLLCSNLRRLFFGLALHSGLSDERLQDSSVRVLRKRENLIGILSLRTIHSNVDETKIKRVPGDIRNRGFRPTTRRSIQSCF